MTRARPMDLVQPQHDRLHVRRRGEVCSAELVHLRSGKPRHQQHRHECRAGLADEPLGGLALHHQVCIVCRPGLLLAATCSVFAQSWT